MVFVALGHLFRTSASVDNLIERSARTRTHNVEYKVSTFAFFKSEELEDAPEGLHLILIARQV